MKKILFMFFVISVISLAENPKVTFVNPAKGYAFFDKVTDYMKIAAEELDIDLEVIYSPSIHRIDIMKTEQKILNSDNKPEYMIYNYQTHATKDILKLAEEKGVYSFVINSAISDEEKENVKTPGDEYKYWIGHIYPNDFEAGYKLGKALINEARRKNLIGKDGKIHIVGISGSYDSNVAIDRDNGLKKAVSEYADVVIDQIVYAYWNSEKAEVIAENLLRRYTEVNIIWSASDAMALGASKIAKSSGKEILVGGIDWSDEGLQGIKNEDISASAGGHFLEGVIALLLIKDHSMGTNISSEKFPIKTNMNVIDRGNIKIYQKLLEYDEFKKIDFKNLTKTNNKNLDEYPYNLFEIMK